MVSVSSHGSRKRKLSGKWVMRILLLVITLLVWLLLFLRTLLLEQPQQQPKYLPDNKPIEPITSMSRLEAPLQLKSKLSGTADQADPLTSPGAKNKAIEYLQAFDDDSFKPSLKFVHLPKVAGTAIEFAGAWHHQVWGGCAFNHRPRRRICPPNHGAEWPEHIGWWHVPAQFFPVGYVNPYRHAFLFAVVRDPYERMVSEFYYVCTMKVKKWRPRECDPDRLYDADYMNEWIVGKINQQELASRAPSAETFLKDNGHFLPQFDYIYGPHGVRVVDFVLRMDNTLNEQFARLMKAFSLEKIVLQRRDSLAKQQQDDTPKLRAENFTASTIKRIHEFYEKDFSVLGFARKFEDLEF